MLHVGGDDTFMENIWLWRGDHWSGPDLEGKSWAQPQWDPLNINPFGLHVTGHSVTCVGAFVEHQLWNPIVWAGDSGLLIMSQGELAYTNNGALDPEVAGKTSKPLAGIAVGIYYTIGAAVTTHQLLGGGLYNIFGTKYSPSKAFFPAIQVLGELDGVQMANTMVAGWAGDNHFSGVLEYNGTKYGPALVDSNDAFYLCDLQKLVGNVPPPPPRPASCVGIQCMISDTDYWGSLPGWPKGTQHQLWSKDMDPSKCCNQCRSEADCAYWKEGNGNCFWYSSNSRVPHDMWRNFSSTHPHNEWTLGLRDDTCCPCHSSSGSACGPTP